MHLVHFPQKKSATSRLASQRTLIEQGLWSNKAAENQSFLDHARKHIELQTSAQGVPLRDSTKELYSRLLVKNLVDFHKLHLDEITRSKVETWWHKSIAKGKLTTSSKSYKLLHAIMSRAVYDGLLPSNPCMIRGAHAANSNKAKCVPTNDEVGQIATAIVPEFRAAVLLAAFGGLRFGEWSALARKDVQLIQSSEGNYFRISVTKALSKVDKRIVIGPTKSQEGNRIIDISSKLSPIISEHLLFHTERGDDGKLFKGKEGDYLRHDLFIRQFNRAVRVSGVRKTNPHMLRNFGASQKVSMGMNFAQLKKWLGDSTDAAALKYVHATLDEANQF
jgi:integrase